MARLLNPAYASVVVAAASTELAAADTDRVVLTIINISDETVWAAIKGGTPVVGTGIPILPSMGINLTKEQFSEGQVNGICASGGKTVVVCTDCPDLELLGSVFNLGAGSATIGAVMIEDKDGTTRLDLKQADAAPATSLQVIPVQQVGESGLSPKVKAADGAIAVDDHILMVQPIDGKGKIAAGGAGGAGGGSMVYRSPRDFTAAYLSGTTLQLAGVSYVPDDVEFGSVKVVKVDHTVEVYLTQDYAFDLDPATNILTVTGAAFLATDLEYGVVVFGPDKAWNQGSDASEDLILNWPEDRELFVIHEDTTNLAGPAAYPYPGAAGFQFVGYRHAALAYKIDDCTMQIFCRNHVDHDWENITHAAYDSLTGGLAPRIIGGAGLALQGVLFWDYFTAAMCYCEITTFDATNLVELSMRLTP